MAAGKSNPFHLANLALAQFLPEMECFLNPPLFGLSEVILQYLKQAYSSNNCKASKISP